MRTPQVASTGLTTAKYGLVVSPGGLTLASGGFAVTGGMTLNAHVDLTSGSVSVTSTNAAATALDITAGSTTGTLLTGTVGAGLSSNVLSLIRSPSTLLFQVQFVFYEPTFV